MFRYLKYYSPFILIVLVILGIYFIQNLKSPPDYRISHGSSIQLVEGFPSIPVYPDSLLTDSIKTPDDDSYTYSSTWETSDSVQHVSLWFIENLPKNGWEITLYPADLQNNSVQLIVIDTPERITNISIIANHEGNSTKIVVEDYKFGAEEEEES